MAQGTGSSDAVVGRVVLDENDIQQALEITPRLKAVLILLPLAVTLGTLAMPPRIPTGAILFICLPLVRRQRRRAARLVLQGLGNRELDTAFEFTENEVSFVRPAGSARLEWSMFRHFTEVPSAFLLYTNAIVYHVIPKRAFAAEDVPRLRALLSARLTPPPAPPVGWKRIIGLWVVLITLFVVIWQLIGKDAGRPFPPSTNERH